jgi:hypothetical protein
MAAKVKVRVRARVVTVKETVETTARVATEEMVTPLVVLVVSAASVEATLDRPSEVSTFDGPSELSERGKTFSQRRTQGKHFGRMVQYAMIIVARSWE